MKKIALVFGVLFTLVSCSQNDRELVPDTQAMSFLMDVSSISPDTRTVVSEDGSGGYAVTWQAGDLLGVYEVGNCIIQDKSVSYPLAYGGSNATFSFSLTGSPQAPFNYTFVYPASALGEMHGHYSVTLPQNQVFTANSFDSSADVLVSQHIQSEERPNSVLTSFARLGGTARMVIKAPSTDEIVQKIVFSTPETCIAGSFKLNPTTGELASGMLEGVTSISLTPVEVTMYSGELEVWFRVAAVTLTSSFTVLVSTDKKTYTKTLDLASSGRELRFVNGKLTRFAVDMRSVSGTDATTYDDTSTYITTSSTKSNKNITIGEEKYTITEYVPFPKIDELRPVLRIPSIVLTSEGTLLASCENREKAEDRGKIDILVARKEKNEEAFEIRRVFEYNDISGRSMNPVFLIDKQTSRIYLFVCHLKDTNKYARQHTTDEVDFVYKYSDDDGRTWSQEHSLKGLWDLTQYTAFIPSSIKGITLSDGTMLLPTMAIKDEEWYSGLLINQNGLWHFSGISPNLGDNECTVYLDNEKRIVLDCRTYEDTRRRYFYDIDLNSFIETMPPMLENEVAISAEVINDQGMFYMGFPDSPRNNRDNLTFWGSKDGINWSKIYRMMDGYAAFGYSSIAANDNLLFSCYETAESIYIQDITPVKHIIAESILSLP